MTTTEPITIAKNSADLILTINDPEPQIPVIVNLTAEAPRNPPTSQSFLVSSTVLSNASTVFNAMLNRGFSESVLPTSPNDHRKITLPDNPSAFHKILLALHHCNLSVPRNLEIGEIYQIASLVDKYDLYEALFPWIDYWCRKNQHRVGIDGKNEDLYLDGDYERVKKSDSRWLFIGWTCRRGKIFRAETEYYMPRLRVMDKTESTREAVDMEEDVYTVYRRGAPVDRERWAVDPIAGLSEKMLDELWDARSAILDPVIGRWRDYHKSLTGAIRTKATVCVHGDRHCDNEGMTFMMRLTLGFGIKSMDVEGEAEQVLAKFSLADIRREMNEAMLSCPPIRQAGYHSSCGVRDAQIRWEGFKGLEPWGSTKKEKY